MQECRRRAWTRSGCSHTRSGCLASQLYTNGDEAPAEKARLFRELVARRARREPLAYVLGEWGFRRLTLRVDPRVLIPRPETEVLVERCLALLADVAEPRVLDIGVGSGAIALAIVDEHPGARVVATDSSADALAVAAENVARTGLPVELVQGELFAGVEGPFDLVVSNPPYVALARGRLAAAGGRRARAARGADRLRGDGRDRGAGAREPGSRWIARPRGRGRQGAGRRGAAARPRLRGGHDRRGSRGT